MGFRMDKASSPPTRNDEETLRTQLLALWRAYEVNCAGLDDLGHFVRTNKDALLAALTPVSETRRIEMPRNDEVIELLEQAYGMTGQDGLLPKGPVLRVVGDAINLLRSAASGTVMVPKDLLLRWAEKIRRRQEDEQVSIDMVEYDMRQMAKLGGPQ